MSSWIMLGRKSDCRGLHSCRYSDSVGSDSIQEKGLGTMNTQFKVMDIGSTGEAGRIVEVAEELGRMYDVFYHPDFPDDLDEGVVREVFVYGESETYVYNNVAADDEAQELYGAHAATREAMGYWYE